MAKSLSANENYWYAPRLPPELRCLNILLSYICSVFLLRAEPNGGRAAAPPGEPVPLLPCESESLREGKCKLPSARPPITGVTGKDI